MKTPITTRAEGEVFLQSLHESGQLFHLEDDPASIIDGDGNPLFTEIQVGQLRARIEELYDLDWGELICPIGYIVQVLWSRNDKVARS
ncbi:hypothetical protein QCN27_15700 [Cereibacter sp. SYSU M97828]|nr:hypothetical protein [Cereibacter flavus]